MAAILAAWWVSRAFVSNDFEWHLLVSSIAQVRGWWLVLACLAIYATYAGRALRWAVFLRPLTKPSILNILSATVIGFTAVVVLGRPGEFVRPYLIARKEKVPVTSQLAAWLLERMFDLLMALTLFGYALSRVTSSAIKAGPGLTWVLAVGGKAVALIGALALLLLIAFRHFAEPARRRIMDGLRFLPEPHFQKMEKFVTAFVQGVESTRSDRALLELLAYSVLEWLLIIGCYWCLALSFKGFSLTIVDVMILLGFVSFGSVVQIPGIGGGMQVVSILVLTELFGLRLELATAFAFLAWIFTFVAIVPVGLLVAVHEGLNWRGIRRLGSEVPS